MLEDNPDKFKEIDALLGNIFQPKASLKEIFENKLEELKLNQTAVLDILGITNTRTLTGILDGTQKMVDFTNLIKIASFLQMPKDEVISLYVESLEKNHQVTNVSPAKIKFIKENFDLAPLKKAGIIENITDFNAIEKNLTIRLGLKSILEYRKPPVDVAFSSGAFNPKNHLTRDFWIQSAMVCFNEIDNQNEYDRKKLIDLFPQIRWHSIDVEIGLLSIIKLLYKIGITVIYQPPLQTLRLRGATFAVNDKPCIVLTNYQGYYPTLWFALIHELYHVLFDWDDIKRNRYHLTDDSNEQMSVRERENMADKFARDYLLSAEKMKEVRHRLYDTQYVKEFAEINHVHPSTVYVFHAFDNGDNDRQAWPRARRYNPDVSEATNKVEIPWPAVDKFESTLKRIRENIYN